MRKILKNIPILIIIGIVFFFASCDSPTDKKSFQERLADINIKMQEALQQVDQLQTEVDVSKFSYKAKELLDSIDNHIEQYHLLMDKTNQKIDKEARNRIINFKQKKVEIEFKLDLLDNGGVYITETDNLSHTDTILTSGNASGSAVSHNIEPLEQDVIDVETIDTTVSSAYRALNDWEYNDTNLKKELLNDMQEIKEVLEIFRKGNL